MERSSFVRKFEKRITTNPFIMVDGKSKALKNGEKFEDFTRASPKTTRKWMKLSKY